MWELDWGSLTRYVLRLVLDSDCIAWELHTSVTLYELQLYVQVGYVDVICVTWEVIRRIYVHSSLAKASWSQIGCYGGSFPKEFIK